MNIMISNLFNINVDSKAFNPSHIVSILDPKIKKEYIPRFSDKITLLQLFFYDEDDLVFQQEPIEVYIKEIINFLSDFINFDSEDKRLLVHCHAGASRSTAIVYILHYMILRNAQAAFEHFLTITNKPWPNRYLIEVADKLLNSQGELLYPLDQYRKNFSKRYDAYRKLNIKRNLNQFVLLDKDYER